MKSPTDYAHDFVRNNRSKGDDSESFKERVNLIKQIQLDAYKQGMTDAAELANQIEMLDGENYGIEETILRSRDETTELIVNP